MKKIMAVAAMAAMVAGAAFAVEFSGSVKASGSLLDYDGTNVNVLSLSNPAVGHQDWGQTGFAASASGEKAGASLHMDMNAAAVQLDGAGVWFKPVDAVKVSLGNQWWSFNSEQIDWSQVQDFGGTGYGVEIAPVAGLTVNVALVDSAWGFGSWMTAGSLTGGTGVKVAYSADFGTVAGQFAMKGTSRFEMGAGYSGSFGPVSTFADVYANIDGGALAGINTDAWVAASVAGVNLKGYVRVKNIAASSADVSLMFKAKADYNLNGYDFYCVVKSDDVLAASKTFVINPGVGFSIGEAGLDVGANITITDKVTVGVPVSVSVGL